MLFEVIQIRLNIIIFKTQIAESMLGCEVDLSSLLALLKHFENTFYNLSKTFVQLIVFTL